MADDITLGEVAREQGRISRRLDDLSEKFVLRREYDKDQQNTDRKITDIATDLAKTDQSVEEVQKEQASLEKERQNQAAARRWQLFLLVATPLATALIGVLIVQGQG